MRLHVLSVTLMVYLYHSLSPRLFNTHLLWVGADSLSPALMTFYLGKVGTHVEDLIFILSSLLFPSTDKDTHTDSKMIIHHVATAALCIGSWFFGYFRIGSVVMLLHDVSDVPLDMVRVFGVLKLKAPQIASMVLTLLAWGYWRLYFFPLKVVRSAMVESSYSPKDAENDPTGAYFVATKSAYVVLLSSLCVLHYVWYWMMLQKCYREVSPAPSVPPVTNKSKDFSQKKED